MSEVSKFQKFEAVTIPRTAIKNAPYNPRTISDRAKSKLKRSLKKNGLVETLIWNTRTGNLVGGHQRISILDDLEGNQDYQLTVARVDLDLKAEKELNILLNNPHTQGEYNFEMLKAFTDIDWDLTGFDPADYSYFKADDVIESMADNISAAEQSVADSLKEITADSDAEKELKKSLVKAIKEQQKADVQETGEKFFVLTFRSVLEKQEFLMKYGFEEREKYIDGYTLESIIKKA